MSLVASAWTSTRITLISGGSSGNVVPGHCRVAGEARAIDTARVTGVIAAMTDAMVWAASENGCEVDIATAKHFTGYRVPDEARSLALAEAALKSRNIEPVRITTGGGSDAHVFRERGMDCLLLANGTYDNHTHHETVPRKNLAEMLEICEEIVRLAAEENGSPEGDD